MLRPRHTPALCIFFPGALGAGAALRGAKLIPWTRWGPKSLAPEQGTPLHVTTMVVVILGSACPGIHVPFMNGWICIEEDECSAVWPGGETGGKGAGVAASGSST